MLFNDTIIAISKTIDGLDSHLNDSDVQTVNTRGKIISPGFIDTHRHTWLALYSSFERLEPYSGSVLRVVQANGINILRTVIKK
jgi:cytosine/adenosine deaminase-related metal-dependent hydrolase